MFKHLISPVQAWLLARGQCVGCGMPLAKGTKKPFKKDLEQITCKCDRVYIFNTTSQTYRRALIEEVK
jgi:hypothetical protein